MMKYINLEEEINPYESIIMYSCGPNFVLNRPDEFKEMIKEQGLIFWFRLWLTICKKPCSNLLKTLEEQWPITSCWASVEIHNNFLTGSADDAINYAMSAISSLQIDVADEFPSENIKKCNPKQAFKCLFKECTEMAFGISLCSIFYKWLFATEFDPSTQTYWTIPVEYLNPNFTPGVLEEFVVKEWKERVLALLGIEGHKIPRWIIRFLHQGPMNLKENVNGISFFLYIKKLSKVMRTRRNQIRIKISQYDEMPLYLEFRNVFYDPDLIKGQANKLHRKRPEGKEMSPMRKVCARCRAVELIYTKFKICPQCVLQERPKPFYYCSDTCLVEDWFQKHCNEHLIK